MKLDSCSVTLYQIKFRTKNTLTAKWVIPNFDIFGYPPGFGAMGPVWQKYGVHATASIKEAHQALKRLSEQNPELDWKIEKVTINIDNTDVAIAFAKTPDNMLPRISTYPTPSDYEAKRRACVVAGIPAAKYVVEGAKDYVPEEVKK